MEVQTSQRNINVVYFLRFEWDSSFRRPYHLEMSKHCRMLGVEFPVTLDLPFRYWSSFKSWLTQKPKLRQINENLYLYRPFSLVCYYLCFRFPFLTSLNRWIVAHSLKPIVKGLNMKDLVVMINHPMMEYVIGTLDEKILCYEVFDEYADEYGLSPGMRRKLQAVEQRILRKAAIVFTSSRLQMENRKAFNDNVYFMPHAVDVEFFAQAFSPETQVPWDVATIPRPRLGFIGNMAQVDVKLLVWLMDRHPEWSLFIIGKRDVEPDGVPDLLTRTNVYYLGFKDYSALPAYLKGLDVGLIPYALDTRTRTVYPNKLNQYLAAGKPVVSTALPELEGLRETIRWATTYEEFEAQVILSLRNLDVDVDRRLRVAQDNSIANRMREKVQILRDHLR